MNQSTKKKQSFHCIRPSVFAISPSAGAGVTSVVQTLSLSGAGETIAGTWGSMLYHTLLPNPGEVGLVLWDLSSGGGHGHQFEEVPMEAQLGCMDLVVIVYKDRSMGFRFSISD